MVKTCLLGLWFVLLKYSSKIKPVRITFGEQQNGPLYYYERLTNSDIFLHVIINKAILNNVHSESSKQEIY